MFDAYLNGTKGVIASFLSDLHQKRQSNLARRAYEMVERYSQNHPWFCGVGELAHRLGISEEKVFEVLRHRIDGGDVHVEIIGTYKTFRAVPKRDSQQPSA